MTVYEKLSQVQSKLNVPKNQVNKFGGYNYRSCEDIMEAVKPVLKEVGATLVVGDDLVQIGDRFYVKACATFIDVESGESITNTAFAREANEKKGMDPSQVTGAASSYARKYAMNGLLALDDVKDADTMDNTSTKGRGKKAVPDADGADLEKVTKITDAMVKSVKSEITKYANRGVTEEKILSKYGIHTIDEMTVEQYRDCMDKFELYKREDKR